MSASVEVMDPFHIGGPRQASVRGREGTRPPSGPTGPRIRYESSVLLRVLGPGGEVVPAQSAPAPPQASPRIWPTQTRTMWGRGGAGR
ncbi:hypothetical protein GCM10028787_26250 [Brachybacterium horti]